MSGTDHGASLAKFGCIVGMGDFRHGNHVAAIYDKPDTIAFTKLWVGECVGH